MTGFNATITEASRELTAREKIKLKDFTNAVALDGVEGHLIIAPEMWAVISVHNEHSKQEKDYKKYVIMDKAGVKYVTGSDSFMSSFGDIWCDMDGEEFEIDIYKMPSKNYSGKSFITCSLV